MNVLPQRRLGRLFANTRAAPPSTDHPKLDFDALYDAEHDFIWRSVQRLGAPEDAVDDAVQIVFMTAARKLDSFEHRSAPRTWLFGIAKRVVKDLRRTRARQRRRRDALAELASRDPARDGYARSDAARTLHQLLEGLDEHKREVFILCELEGMTGPEVAQMLQLKLPTVYARLRSARQQLERAAEQLEATQLPTTEAGSACRT